MKRIRVVVGVMAVLSVGAVAVWTRQMETDQSGPEGSSPPQLQRWTWAVARAGIVPSARSDGEKLKSGG